MHKVLIKLGLKNLRSVIGIGKLKDGDAVLLSIGLKDVGEVRGLGFGRDTKSVRSEPGETSDGIHSGLGNPDGMVLLDKSRGSGIEMNTEDGVAKVHSSESDAP